MITDSLLSCANLQQEDGVEEAEEVQQRAHNQQDGSVTQTGAVEQEQMTRHQAARQPRQPVQQLHFHHGLHNTAAHQSFFLKLIK